MSNEQWTKAGLNSREAMLMEATLAATADLLQEQNKRLSEVEAGRGVTQTKYLVVNADGSIGPDCVDAATKSEVVALRDQVANLERKLAAVEREKGIAYRGVWEAGEEYVAGDYVTDKGSLWHANETTRSRPGTSDDWQLAVKNGKGGER